MPTSIKINHAADHVGQDVTLTGWVQKRIDKGRLQFVHLRDGTGVMQCVVFKKNLPEEQFDAARHITMESAVSITGALRADERAPGGYELDANAFQVIGRAEDPYPLAPKRDGGEHGSDFLLNNRHLWLRDPRQTAILRTRATLISAIRNWLDDQGFVLVDTPIITPAAAEGTSNLFATEYFEEPAYLAQTGQLYSEATIGAFGRVYCFGPTFRAEKSDTRRHAMEFWMVEPEMAFTELDENMEVIEQFVSHCVQTVLRERAADLEALERDTALLQNVLPPSRASTTTTPSSCCTPTATPTFPGARTSARPTRTPSAPSSTNRSLSITTRAPSRLSTCSRTPIALRPRWPAT